jgi:hypothetical protein
MDIPAPIQRDIEDIDVLLGRGRLRSAIKLIHALVEQMASLSMPEDSKANTRGDYESFLVRFVFPCLSTRSYEARDLYASRCGFIHGSRWIGQGPTSVPRRSIKWDFRVEGTPHAFGAICYDQDDCLSSIGANLNLFWIGLKRGIARFFSDLPLPETTIQERFKWQADFIPLVLVPHSPC